MHLPTTYSSSNVILFTPSRFHGEAQPAAQFVELVQLVAHGLAPPRQVSRIVTSATRPNGAERWQVSPLRRVTGVTWCLYITGQIFWKENGEPYSLQLQRTLENKTRYGFLVGKLSEGQMRPCFQFAKMLSKQILITMSHLNSSIINSSTNIPFEKCGFFSKLIHSLSKKRVIKDIVNLLDVETQLGDSKFWTYRIHPADWPVETAAPVPEMTDGCRFDGWRYLALHPKLGNMAKLIL